MFEENMNKCTSCKEILDQFKTDNNLLDILYSLTPREYCILLLRVIQNLSLEQIANKWSVTRERIRFIEEKAFKKITYKAFHLYKIKLTTEDILKLLKDNIDKLPFVKKQEAYIVDDNEMRKSKNPFELIISEHQKIKHQIILEDLDNCAIESLDFTARTKNCLLAVNISNLQDLINKSEIDLLKIKNFGRKSIWEVKTLLKDRGLELKKN